VIFAGGGTGGHLYPGLAIARALVRQAPDIEPFFVGALRGIEREILPTTEFKHALLDLHPLYRSAPWKNWRTLASSVGAMRSLNAIARERRPVAVVGTGGYAAGAALAWARLHDTLTVLHEPDSHPGLTTRAFARGADAIFLGFAEAASRLSPSRTAKVLPLGSPIEPPPTARMSRASARALWDLPENAFVVLVTGGSQGARALNEAVAAWCARGLPANVALVWATGRASAAAYADRESRMVRVRAYLSPIADAYAAADVAITRAGAMTIAELCAWTIPAVLVPLPTAAQDHQTSNARATAAAGAAIYLPQSEMSAESLDATVRELMKSPATLASMQDAAARRARPGAAADIARALLSLLPPH
jgi:UDP-N-acetylglucosamine--N-acetylmuramyl-(pentapeptide) pyrophosphoryl-undecaprenol N-acetylglucosamine transferase